MKKERKPLINDTFDWFGALFLGIFLLWFITILLFPILFRNGGGAESVESLAVLQEMLLREEGVPFLPDGRVDLEKALWP